jgi:hypothetical protein
MPFMTPAIYTYSECMVVLDSLSLLRTGEVYELYDFSGLCRLYRLHEMHSGKLRESR